MNKTNISAQIVVDSSNSFNNRITTMVVTFPRFILAELNTHRMFSRNSASSRAIPFKKMVESVRINPFIPIAWQKDHSGMQGTEYLSKTEKFGLSTFIASLIDTLNTLNKGTKEYESLEKEITEKVNLIEGLLSKYRFEEKTLNDWWLFARDKAVEAACIMYVFRTTKQLANRLLEPFMWHTVIVTSTEWENFFALRCPKYAINCGPDDTDESTLCTGRSWKDLMQDKNGLALDFQTDNIVEKLLLNKGQAEIHMMALAEAMWDALNESQPEFLRAGKWHIPFVKIEDFLLPNDLKLIDVPKAVKIATARCARVSYTTVGEEGKPANYENDINLHDNLAKSGHWSPFEHIAKCMSETEYNGVDYPSMSGDTYGWSGNFRGFIQYRKLFANENIELK